MSYKDYNSRVLVAGSEKSSQASANTVLYSVNVTEGVLETRFTGTLATELGDEFMQKVLRKADSKMSVTWRTVQEKGDQKAGRAILSSLDDFGYPPRDVDVIRVDEPCTSSSTKAKEAWENFRASDRSRWRMKL
jgi:hypothetical protein